MLEVALRFQFVDDADIEGVADDELIEGTEDLVRRTQIFYRRGKYKENGFAFAQQGYRFTGVDPSKRMLDTARSKSTLVEWLQGRERGQTSFR